jgi:hypothetical protein
LKPARLPFRHPGDGQRSAISYQQQAESGKQLVREKALLPPIGNRSLFIG